MNAKVINEQVHNLPLKDIHVSGTNPRKYFDKTDMADLEQSIARNGVISPIKVRPKDGTYEIIYGEKRYHCSISAGKEFIPAIIIEATDEEVEKLQFIENMDRSDVHPMDEAIKFNEMVTREHNPYTVLSISEMIGKGPWYIVQRMELVKLSPQLKKDFWAGMFNITVAIQFARLTLKEQKELRERCYSSESKSYCSGNEIKSFINKYIIRDLNNAPFDTADPNLYPKAGVCGLCPKRSGANVLFADVKDKNICFDKDCFSVKFNNHMTNIIEETIATKPDTVFMKEGYASVEPAIEKVLVKNEITLQSTYETRGLSSYNQKGSTAVKVMMVSGTSAGKLVTYYRHAPETPKKKDIKELKKQNAKSEDMLTAIKDNIDGIKTREIRARELDDEKIWERIRNEVIGAAKDIIPGDAPLTNIEIGAVVQAMRNSLKGGSFPAREKLATILPQVSQEQYKYDGETILKALEEHETITMAQFYQVCRLFITDILNVSGMSHTSRLNQALMKRVAEQEYAEDINRIQAEQDIETEKRNVRVDSRLEVLEKEKKDVLSKEKFKKVGKDKGAAAKKEDKPAKKRAASKSSKKAVVKKQEEEDELDENEEYNEDQGDDIDDYQHEPMDDDDEELKGYED